MQTRGADPSADTARYGTAIDRLGCRALFVPRQNVRDDGAKTSATGLRSFVADRRRAASRYAHSLLRVDTSPRLRAFDSIIPGVLDSTTPKAEKLPMESPPDPSVDRLAELVPGKDAVNDALPRGGRRDERSKINDNVRWPENHFASGRQPTAEVTISSTPRPSANRRLPISNRSKEHRKVCGQAQVTAHPLCASRRCQSTK